MGGPVIDGGYGASVQSALAMGRRFGFVGGSDTHRGNPGGPSHPLHPYFIRWKPTTGITAAAAPSLTREALWGALWNRRTYATTGPRILLDFAVNSHPMGSELPPQDEAKVEAFVAAAAELDTVELIKDNEVCHAVDCKGTRIARLDFTDPRPGKYYYLRVRQRDGHHAYASPVWTG